MYKILLVGTGGFIGTIARYVASTTIDSRFNTVFPYGTFFVNIVGSFILGLVYGFLLQRPSEAQHFRLLLITGFCGGFTTFSAFAFENLRLIEQKMPAQSLIYIGLSVLLGIGSVFAGIWLTKA